MGDDNTANDALLSYRNRNGIGKSFLSEKLSSFDAASKVTSSLNINRNPVSHQSALGHNNVKIEDEESKEKKNQNQGTSRVGIGFNYQSQSLLPTKPSSMFSPTESNFIASYKKNSVSGADGGPPTN